MVKRVSKKIDYLATSTGANWLVLVPIYFFAVIIDLKPSH
ncbi:hypothetical protein HMPREF0623_0114 [Pediococcus acidilactici DSM 20284]|uniref:Uncharacterized protein n=1 Tax=Pediococcus acidilactici DSM 20284 TaxID=862514 RepID=E0NEQ2_PEDAC|nr:hypothetical protein HMPREF0623_0114 [Pediococcus acidilactici DSM 20284]